MNTYDNATEDADADLMPVDRDREWPEHVDACPRSRCPFHYGRAARPSSAAADGLVV